jgi:surface antigen
VALLRFLGCVARSSRAKRLALGLFGLVGVSVATMAFSQPAEAAARFSWRQGYSIQHGSLCYGWPNHALHCTSRWHRTSSGQPVSDNPAWVPNVGSVGGTSGGVKHTPAGIGPWAPVPGHPSFAVSRPANNFYGNAFGQCTWWAQWKRRDENLRGMGDAHSWAAGARARGYRVGSVPRPGATIVFQPWVQGASGLGHVGHVEEVYDRGGWLMISEMNFFWNGGGWGRVDYRYVHTGPGVAFIY